jgi:hypothetical protein
MLPSTFTLHVPAGAPYRALAPAVGARFLELAGGQPAECAAFEQALAQAIDDLAGTAETVDLTFSGGPAGVDVSIAAGGRHAALHHART